MNLPKLIWTLLVTICLQFGFADPATAQASYTEWGEVSTREQFHGFKNHLFPKGQQLARYSVAVECRVHKGKFIVRFVTMPMPTDMKNKPYHCWNADWFTSGTPKSVVAKFGVDRDEYQKYR